MLFLIVIMVVAGSTGNRSQADVNILAIVWFHGKAKSKRQSRCPLEKLNTLLHQAAVAKCFGFNIK